MTEPGHAAIAQMESKHQTAMQSAPMALTPGWHAGRIAAGMLTGLLLVLHC
jgi:hypothetical protein